MIERKKIKKTTRSFTFKPSFFGQVLVFHSSAFTVDNDAFENPTIIGYDKIPGETTINF